MNPSTSRPGRLVIEASSLPIFLLTIALVLNFFWRAQLFTGNNLPPVVLLAVLFIGLWSLHGLGITGVLAVRVPRIFWPLSLYVLAVLLSIALRGDFAGRTIQFALRLIVLFLLALLVTNLARTWGALEGSIFLLILGFCLAAFYGFADYLLNNRYYLNIFAGIARKNASGYYFMAILPFIFFCLRSPHIGRVARQWLMFAFVLSFAAMLLTLARSAVVGLAAGLFAVFVLYSRRINWRIVLALLVLVTASYVAAPDSVKRRLGTTFDFEERAATSNSSRLILLRAGLRMAQAEPLLGVGIGRFDENLDLYTSPRERSLLGFETYEASHNQYVAALNDGGVLALLAVLWLLLEILVGLHLRLRRSDVSHRYLLMAFAAFWWSQAAHFMVEWQLARELFWFMVGLTGAALYLTSPQHSERVRAFVVMPRVAEA